MLYEVITFEEAGEFIAAGADGTRQGNPGEEGGAGGADVGVGGLEPVLGLEDVGSGEQHLRGEPGGDVLQAGELRGERRREQLGRERCADHQGQGVDVLGDQGGEAGDVDSYNFV